ncbi:unnamed protein product [Bursaphelenchus okinawaensis]|uniref:Ig-like domain-containing protein n=1 Tax=Bursaphelenchus okinawaensis TaxID=465554 RepID=A0A811KP44_9BILA|nr:unnamed protein product [Bursaphelenchus okinawaensis]CAG9106301.1 unnamed protein product [Bursaphelenchus okinawaensis]
MVFGTVLSLTTTLSMACIYNPAQCPNGTSNAVPPPQITYGPSNQTILTHEVAILPCQFTPAPPGRDPPNVSWFHNSIPVDRGNARYSVSPSGTLKITDLR